MKCHGPLIAYIARMPLLLNTYTLVMSTGKIPSGTEVKNGSYL